MEQSIMFKSRYNSVICTGINLSGVKTRSSEVEQLRKIHNHSVQIESKVVSTTGQTNIEIYIYIYMTTHYK
jgi:hypothetical protein